MCQKEAGKKQTREEIQIIKKKRIIYKKKNRNQGGTWVFYKTGKRSFWGRRRERRSCKGTSIEKEPAKMVTLAATSPVKPLTKQ